MTPGRIWIQIKRRCHPPTRCLPQEAVVAQVIVRVSNQRIEQYAPQELRKIRLHRSARPVVLDEFGDFGITPALAVVPLEQRHGGNEETATARRAVKPL